jgi:hypothetical protein
MIRRMTDIEMENQVLAMYMTKLVEKAELVWRTNEQAQAVVQEACHPAEKKQSKTLNIDME